MDEAKFFESFQFNIYTPARYRLTDYSKRPIPRHYFGCLVRGTAIIKSEKTELSLKPGEIFYIPKGLTYQSQWFGDEEKKIEFYSFGFGFSPTGKSFALQKIAPNLKLAYYTWFWSAFPWSTPVKNHPEWFVKTLRNGSPASWFPGVNVNYLRFWKFKESRDEAVAITTLRQTTLNCRN